MLPCCAVLYRAVLCSGLRVRGNRPTHTALQSTNASPARPCALPPLLALCLRRRDSRSREELRRAEKEVASLASRELLDESVGELRQWRSHAAVELDELREAAASAAKRAERVRNEVDGASLVAQKAEARARHLGVRALSGLGMGAGEALLALEGGGGNGQGDTDSGIVAKVRASIAAAEQRMLRTLTDRMHDKIDVGFAQRREALSERTLAGEMRALHDRQALSSKLRECQSMVESLSARIGEEQRRFDRSAEREQGTVDATVRKISEAEFRVDDVVQRCEGICAKIRERVARAAQTSSGLETLASQHSRNAAGESSRLAELEQSAAIAAERRRAVEKSVSAARSLAQDSLLGANVAKRLREGRDDIRTARRDAQRILEKSIRSKLSAAELRLGTAVSTLEQENRGQVGAAGAKGEVLLQRIDELSQRLRGGHVSAAAEDAVKAAASTGAGAAVAGLQAVLSAHESRAATLGVGPSRAREEERSDDSLSTPPHTHTHTHTTPAQTSVPNPTSIPNRTRSRPLSRVPRESSRKRRRRGGGSLPLSSRHSHRSSACTRKSWRRANSH